MNKPTISQFIELLEAQAAGDTSAIDRLRELDIRIGDGGCIFNLYQQWRGAFFFPGGRIEAFQPLLSPSRKVEQYLSDDVLEFFASPE